MPTPTTTTTNITIGSILDLLAPTSASLKNDGDQGGFDSLLQPPAPPAPPASAPRQADAPPPAAVHRESEPSKAPCSPEPAEEPAASATDSAAPKEQAKGDANKPAPNEDKAPPTDDSLADDLAEGCDEEAAAESLAALALVPSTASLPDVVEVDEPHPDAAPAETIAPAAAKRPGSKAAANKAPHSAGEAVATDKPVAVEPLKAADDEQGGERLVRRGSARRTDSVPEEPKGQSKDSAQAQANGSPITTGDVDPNEPAASLENFSLVKVDPITRDKAPSDDRQGSTPEQSSPAAAAESSTDATKAPDQSPVTNKATAAIAAVPVPTPTSTHPASAPSSGSSAATTSPQSVGARTRAPLASPGEAAGDVRRGSRVEIDTARLLSRVTRAFQVAQQRDGELRLRLSPPELGSLRLLVQVQDGALVARLETETTAAKTALLDNLPALKERLAEQGVRIERFDVDLMQQQSGGMPDRPQDQERNVPQPARAALVNRPRSESSSTPRPAVAAVDPTGRLNVIV